MTSLTLRHISRVFGERTALHDIDIDVHPGEFFSILGPSGCGKTTLLRIIAGFEKPDAGSVVISGRDVTHVPPEQRAIGMVFQNYALFPHMNVYENVAFGLQVRHVERGELRRRVSQTLASVALDGREREPVVALSGGEQQRVAVARALVIEPDILLFDEPLSNLDASLRQHTREEIRSIQRKTSITTLYVTHDQAEALSLSDRLAIMREGRIEQIGTPEEVYQRPATPFVARFLGWGNVLAGSITPEGLAIGESVWPIPSSARGARPGPVTIALPLDAITVVAEGYPGAIKAAVVEMEYLGIALVMTARVGETEFKALHPPTGGGVHVGDNVNLGVDWSQAIFYPIVET